MDRSKFFAAVFRTCISMILILPAMKQMFQGDGGGGASKIQCTVAENVRAQLWHIIQSQQRHAVFAGSSGFLERK